MLQMVLWRTSLYKVLYLDICFLVIEAVPPVDFGRLFLKQEHMVGGVLLAGMALIWKSELFVKDCDSQSINSFFPLIHHWQNLKSHFNFILSKNAIHIQLDVFRDG